ncbi:MAG: EthD family reductase [Pseudomonadales bacterium]
MKFKAIILLKRKEDLSREDFIRWWLETHKPLALQLPGLKKMCINISQNEDAEYDGASELWFDSEAAFINAYATPLGQRVAADSLSMVSRRDRLFVEEVSLEPVSG